MHPTDTAAQQKTDLKSLSREQLRQFCLDQGLQRYRADQIFQWLYQKQATDFSQMTNLSKELRATLDEQACIHGLELVQQHESSDGTIKFLFGLFDSQYVETVMIPEFDERGEADRLTVCVSSQVGCVFGCKFCATGKMGFFRNLTPGEIVDQLTWVNGLCQERFGRRITNVVYMGMGEPLHNYKAVTESANILADPQCLELSPRRITVSTVGLARQIRKLGDEGQPFNLALSLHAPNDEKRGSMMPVNNSTNLQALREALAHYYEQTGLPVTYEYLLFDEYNDTDEDARQLARIARWIPSKVNIIMYNNVPGVQLQRAREERLDRFMKALADQGVRATVRRSRGDDIDAGCGQLAIDEQVGQGKSLVRE